MFVVGGGNYIEYQNLVDHANTNKGSLASGLSSTNLSGMTGSTSTLGLGETTKKKIIYGCTTLQNANQMMQQLSKLGHEM